MTLLRLKFVHRFRDRHGKVRHYFRRRGAKAVPLSGLPGSAESGADTPIPQTEIGAARSRPGSVAAAVAAYLGSIDFGNLAPATRYNRRLILERFREIHGEKPFSGMGRKNVELMLAAKSSTPHAARSFLKALRAVIAVARRINSRDDDPTIGVRVKVRATAGSGLSSCISTETISEWGIVAMQSPRQPQCQLKS